MDIDDILMAIEAPIPQTINNEKLAQARNKIKKLNEIGASNVYIVTNKNDKGFYRYCRLNKLPYGKDFSNRHTLMSQEQYLMFCLSDINHKAKFYEQITNAELLQKGLYQ